MDSFSKQCLNFFFHSCRNFLTNMSVDCKRVERTIPWNLVSLTYIGPFILIYYYNKSQRDALFLKFI